MQFKNNMKKFLIVIRVIYVLAILLVFTWLVYPEIVTGLLPLLFAFYVIFFITYVPMFVIETIALVWFFKDFSTSRAIFIAFTLYSVTFFILLSFSSFPKQFINIGMGVGLISLIVHLFLLKFLFKVSFSIMKSISIVLAHIVFFAVWYLGQYEMNQRPSQMIIGVETTISNKYIMTI